MLDPWPTAPGLTGGGGGGGVTVHNELTGRSANNAHPTSAITDLDATLATFGENIEALGAAVFVTYDGTDAPDSPTVGETWRNPNYFGLVHTWTGANWYNPILVLDADGAPLSTAIGSIDSHYTDGRSFTIALGNSAVTGESTSAVFAWDAELEAGALRFSDGGGTGLFWAGTDPGGADAPLGSVWWNMTDGRIWRKVVEGAGTWTRWDVLERDRVWYLTRSIEANQLRDLDDQVLDLVVPTALDGLLDLAGLTKGTFGGDTTGPDFVVHLDTYGPGTYYRAQLELTDHGDGRILYGAELITGQQTTTYGGLLFITDSAGTFLDGIKDVPLLGITQDDSVLLVGFGLTNKAIGVWGGNYQSTRVWLTTPIADGEDQADTRLVVFSGNPGTGDSAGDIEFVLRPIYTPPPSYV